jgi:hypothetical protein
MRKIVLFNTLFLLPICGAFAQTTKEAAIKKMTDSIRMAYLSEAAIQYPILRQGFISTDVIGTGNIKSKLRGNDFFEAKSQVTRMRANFNLPIAQWSKNIISANVNYLFQHVDISQVNSYDPLIPVRNNLTNSSTIALTLSYNRVDSLFGHQVIFSANISGVTDELSSIRRVNELVGVTVPIVRTAATVFRVGLFYINDPTLPTHLVPLITYSHKFQTGNLQFFADLPTRVLLKKQLSEKTWLSIGTELTGTQTFMSFNEPSMPRDVVHSTTELKTGPAFEYKVSKKIMLGVSAGLFTTLSSRIFEQGKAPSTYFIENKMGATPYANFTISFLPFLKSIVRK